MVCSLNAPLLFFFDKKIDAFLYINRSFAVEGNLLLLSRRRATTQLVLIGACSSVTAISAVGSRSDSSSLPDFRPPTMTTKNASLNDLPKLYKLHVITIFTEFLASVWLATGERVSAAGGLGFSWSERKRPTNCLREPTALLKEPNN